MAYGRSAGLWTAWGIATGILFHVTYGLFGLGWLLRELPSLLDALRYAGAGFLIYMGIGGLRAQARDPATLAQSADRAIDPRRHFGIGVLTNVLNPKAMLWFTSLFAAVITTQAPMPLRVAVAAWLIVSTAVWFSIVALTLGHSRVRGALIAQAHWIDRATGAILVALGVALIFARL
jgi:threonine/homoserine/homoserine lactone efflux protein